MCMSKTFNVAGTEELKCPNIVHLNTYWQRFGYSDVDGAVAGGLQDVHGIIQAGALQVSFINEHESVTGEQATISIRHTSRHQGADYQNGLSGVFWILELDRSEGSDAE